MDEPAHKPEGKSDAAPVLHIARVDAEKLGIWFREFREARQSQIAAISSMVDRTLRQHENSASLQEKIILLDGAAIGLSLTFLGYLTSHASGGHLAKWPVILLLCPAWLLFLISIFYSWLQIASFHSVNGSLLRQLSAIISSHHHGYLGVLMAKVPGILQAQVTMGAETIDVAAFSSTSAEYLGKVARQEAAQLDDLVKKATETAGEMPRYGKFVGRATLLAVLLLCAFALVAAWKLLSK